MSNVSSMPGDAQQTDTLVSSELSRDLNAAVRPRLRVVGISKHFGGISALDDVSLEINPGEILGLVGNNGAGKSTLVKILAGVHQPSAGQIWLDGEQITLSSPADARRVGIETVYQDLALVGSFDVAANFFLGRELWRGGWLAPLRILDGRAMRKRAEAGVTSLHVRIPRITNELRQMSGGQRQGVAIARAAFWHGRLLLLDEPTAALGVEEGAEVMALIRRLADQGLSIIMISHNLEHVWSMCDRLAILRQGKMVAHLLKSETTPEQVVGFVTGAHLAERAPSAVD